MEYHLCQGGKRLQQSRPLRLEAFLGLLQGTEEGDAVHLLPQGVVGGEGRAGAHGGVAVSDGHDALFQADAVLTQEIEDIVLVPEQGAVQNFVQQRGRVFLLSVQEGETHGEVRGGNPSVGGEGDGGGGKVAQLVLQGVRQGQGGVVLRGHLPQELPQQAQLPELFLGLVGAVEEELRIGDAVGFQGVVEVTGAVQLRCLLRGEAALLGDVREPEGGQGSQLLRAVRGALPAAQLREVRDDPGLFLRCPALLEGGETGALRGPLLLSKRPGGQHADLRGVGILQESLF